MRKIDFQIVSQPLAEPIPEDHHESLLPEHTARIERFLRDSGEISSGYTHTYNLPPANI